MAGIDKKQDTGGKLKSVLNMQIGRKDKYPSKTTLNLLYKESRRRENTIAILLFLVYLVCLYFFTRYMVIGRLAMADAAEQRYNHAVQALADVKQSNRIYEKVRAEYSHYGNGYLNEEEKSLQDRMTILDVLDEKIGDKGMVRNITLNGNLASVTMELEDAALLPEIIGALEQSEAVLYVTASQESSRSSSEKIRLDTEGFPLNLDMGITTELHVFFREPAEAEGALQDRQANAAGEVG